MPKDLKVRDEWCPWDLLRPRKYQDLCRVKRTTMSIASCFMLHVVARGDGLPSPVFLGSLMAVRDVFTRQEK